MADGAIDLTAPDHPDASSAERLAALEALPGIGPVTAGYLAMLLGSYDTLVLDSSTGDFAVRTFGPAAADPDRLARHFTALRPLAGAGLLVSALGHRGAGAGAAGG